MVLRIRAVTKQFSTSSETVDAWEKGTEIFAVENFGAYHGKQVKRTDATILHAEGWTGIKLYVNEKGESITLKF